MRRDIFGGSFAEFGYVASKGASFHYLASRPLRFADPSPPSGWLDDWRHHKEDPRRRPPGVKSQRWFTRSGQDDPVRASGDAHGVLVPDLVAAAEVSDSAGRAARTP